MVSSVELSVIIPTCSRRDLLRRCLGALGRQTQDPSTFEVIVAEDGSTDGTADMAERLPTPFRLRVLRLEKRGKPAARNAGIDAAEGSICVFIDDDVVPSPSLVAAHLTAHGAADAIIGIGALTQAPLTAHDWYADAFARTWNAHYEELVSRRPSWTDCYGANVSVKRSNLLAVGKFSEDFPTAQDTELAFRLWSRGCVPTYVPAAHGVHDDQKPGRRILRDAGRRGADSIPLVESHPETFEARLGGFAEPRRRDAILRRLLLGLRTPPTLLVWAGRLMPGAGRRQRWFFFVDAYAFWQGVRGCVTRRQWRKIVWGEPFATGDA
jgi:glycosyltransferase involved in cell wall biosynthesis